MEEIHFHDIKSKWYDSNIEQHCMAPLVLPRGETGDVSMVTLSPLE